MALPSSHFVPSRSPPPRCHLICLNLGGVRGLGIDWHMEAVSPKHAKRRRALAAQNSLAKAEAMLLAPFASKKQARCDVLVLLAADSRRNLYKHPFSKAWALCLPGLLLR
jgi:hypothetical protein